MTPAILNVSRRGFLSQIFSAGALVIAVPLVPKLKAAQTWQPSVYLGIEPDGTVKIVAHRSEMGTGCRTGLPMIVADELEADWARVQVIQALGDAKYGSQNTDGSCSVRDFYDALRAAGASARTMLENAAATKWGVVRNRGAPVGTAGCAVPPNSAKKRFQAVVQTLSNATIPEISTTCNESKGEIGRASCRE